MLRFERKPFGIWNRNGDSEFFFVCDHAANFIPKSLSGLGLGKIQLASHIAYDIGALSLSKIMAKKLNAPLIWQNYSRLMIDSNRHLEHEKLIPEESDGVVVEGNDSIDEEIRNERIDLIFTPYHDKIAELLNEREKQISRTIFVSVHSFTPLMKGFRRPWEIGVLSGNDKIFSKEVLKFLKTNEEYCIGDNEPYKVDSKDFTIPEHAIKRGLPYVLLEVRQDLISARKGRKFWAEIISLALSKARESF